MFEIWFRCDGQRAYSRVESLAAAQMIWDALRGAGFHMESARP